MRKINESLKNKAELEDLESLNNLINELYDRIVDIEKASGTSETNMRPPIQRISIGTSALGGRGNNNIAKDLADLQEKFSAIIK